MPLDHKLASCGAADLVLLTAQEEVAALCPGQLLLDFVDYLKQHFQRGVGPLRVAPADAYPGRSGRVYGELDPGGPSPRVHCVGPTADDQMWIQALNLLCERLQRGTLHLGAGTKYPDAGGDRLPVSAVFVLEGDQDPRGDQLLLAAPSSIPSSIFYAPFGGSVSGA